MRSQRVQIQEWSEGLGRFEFRVVRHGQGLSEAMSFSRLLSKNSKVDQLCRTESLAAREQTGFP